MEKRRVIFSIAILALLSLAGVLLVMNNNASTSTPFYSPPPIIGQDCGAMHYFLFIPPTGRIINEQGANLNAYLLVPELQVAVQTQMQLTIFHTLHFASAAQGCQIIDTVSAIMPDTPYIQNHICQGIETIDALFTVVGCADEGDIALL